MASPVDFDRAAVDIVPGFFASGRQPDGNSVIFSSSDGLIVFDTGRHADHVQKIVDLADARGQPVAAIINSHWHLDHVSGNLPLRKRWPDAAVYANDTALTDALGTFLERGLAANRLAVEDPGTLPDLAEDLRGDIATVEQGEQLHPAVNVTASTTLTIGGRRLELHTASAASAGDIWLYDPAARRVAAGDLVTLPAPFLDTACPQHWRDALDDVLGTPFARLVPGHGREMNRAEVRLYRDSFNALLDCAQGGAMAAACAEAWAVAVAPLLDAPADEAAARRCAAYYVTEILRTPSARPVWCAMAK
jgi:glyoxylase-like metal-dependent hydrolase (beta-lactamase superfamily II)